MTTATKTSTSWHSERVGCELNVVRWGHFGQPVLLFPTAGGDAEEMERMHMIRELSELLEAGRIKIYSVDSVAARDWSDTEVSGESKCELLDAFQNAIRQEVVPAIRADCEDEEAEIIAAGASIGAFNALSAVCRWPDAFQAGVCVSGSYDVDRFMKNAPTHDQHLYFSMPSRYLPNLDEGPLLERLRTRKVIFAHGGGRWEDPEQDWGMAATLGKLGIPNRVDPWGDEYDHDWPTWRAMFPKYLDELTKPADEAADEG
jgi:esterase/lipase superfamily enzyme